jgi:hypothetical protein
MKTSLTTSRPWALATALITATAATCQGVTPPSLRASGGALSSPSNSNSNNEEAATMSYRRSLQDNAASAISLLESGEGVHTVTLAQTFFGTPSEDEAVCGSTEKDAMAWIMFATWLDPDTLEEVCGLWERDVTACFQETVAIGCDPNTNTATINVYVRDESFVPMRDFQVDNPKLGRCAVGKKDVGYKAIHVQETFQCLVGGLSGGDGPSGVGETPGMCGADYDECLDGTYCNFNEMIGWECKAYVAPGSTCGGLTIPGEDNRCNPEEAFCAYPQSCWSMRMDGRGKCVAYGASECVSSDNCEPGEWCDTNIGKCKIDLAKDECCSANIDNCADGLTCVAQYFDFMGLQDTCRTVCDDDTDCVTGEWCGDSDESLERFCKPYAGTDKDCEVYTMAAFYEKCDPDTHFCMDSMYCEIANGGGKCTDMGNVCETNDSECADPTTEWCDTKVGKCKPKYEQGACCDASFKTMCEDGTECETEPAPKDLLTKEAPKCRLPETPLQPPISVAFCSTKKPQLCGGFAGIHCACTCEDTSEEGPICLDDPSDKCDPKTGGADCAGICTCPID